MMELSEIEILCFGGGCIILGFVFGIVASNLISRIVLWRLHKRLYKEYTDQEKQALSVLFSD